MTYDLHHVAYWTDDLGAAVALYKSLYDAEVFVETVIPETGNKVAFVRFGKMDVELIEPADRSLLNGQSGLQMHHVGYFVPELEARMAELAAQGVTFATDAPVNGPDGSRLIYLDGAHTLGARMHISERGKSPIAVE